MIYPFAKKKKKDSTTPIGLQLPKGGNISTGNITLKEEIVNKTHKLLSSVIKQIIFSL